MKKRGGRWSSEGGVRISSPIALFDFSSLQLVTAIEQPEVSKEAKCDVPALILIGA